MEDKDNYSRNVDLDQFHEYIRQGNKSEVLKCIKLYPHIVNKSNKKHETALHIASRHLDGSKLIGYVLQGAINVNARNVWGQTPLHYAAEVKSICAIRALLRTPGSDVNSQDVNGYNALHHYVRCCQVYTTERNTWTQCKDRTDSEWCKGFELLVQAGADINCKTNFGHTILHLIAARFYNSTEILAYVFRNYSNIDMTVTNNMGQNFLHIYMKLGNANNYQNMVLFDILKAKSQLATLLNSKDLCGSVPWERIHEHLFSEECLFKLIHIFGAAINSTDNMGNTLLHHLVNTNGDSELRVSLTKILIQSGIDINRSNIYDHTAIFQCGDERLYMILFENGADLKRKDIWGRTPFLSILNRDPFPQYVETMIQVRKTDVFSKDKNNTTPLHVVAYNGNQKHVELLMKCGATLNVHDKENDTPLQTAYRSGHFNCYKLLSSAMLNSAGTILPLYEAPSCIKLSALLKADGCFSKIVKDFPNNLQEYSEQLLAQKHVSTQRCPERSELVELTLEHSDLRKQHSEQAGSKIQYSEQADTREQHLQQAGSKMQYPEQADTREQHSEQAGSKMQYSKQADMREQHSKQAGSKMQYSEQADTRKQHSEQARSKMQYSKQADTMGRHLEQAGSKIQYSEQADTKEQHSEQAGSKMQYSKQADMREQHSKQAGSKMQYPEQADTREQHSEQAGSKMQCSEQASTIEQHSEQVGSNMQYPEQADKIEQHSEQVGSKMQYSEQADTREQHSEQAGSKMQYSEQADTREQHSEQAGSKMQYSEQADRREQHLEQAGSKMQYSEQADTREQHLEQAGSKMQCSEQADTKEQDLEQAGSKMPYSEQVDTREQHSEQAGSKMQYSEQADTREQHSDQAGSKMQYSEQAVTREQHSEQAGSKMQYSEQAGLRQSESYSVTSAVNKLVLRICDFVKSYDRRFEIVVYPTGSSAEGTKAGRPDEFDFALCLTPLADLFEIENTCVPGLESYAFLKYKDTVIPEDYIPFCDQDHYFLAHPYLHYLFSYITRALCEKELFSLFRDNLYMGLDRLYPLRGKTVFNFTAYWSGSKYKHLEISIDLVPVVYKPGWWPDGTTVTFETSRIVTRDVINVGCFLMLHTKSNEFGSCCLYMVEDSINYTCNHVSQTGNENNHRRAMHVSVSPAEIALMTSLPYTFRQAYALAKIFKLPKVCPKIMIDVDSEPYEEFRTGGYTIILNPFDNVKSYWLKNCALYVAESDSDITGNTSPLDITRKIYDKLLEFATSCKISAFLLRNVDVYGVEKECSRSTKELRKFLMTRKVCLDLILGVLGRPLPIDNTEWLASCETNYTQYNMSTEELKRIGIMSPYDNPTKG